MLYEAIDLFGISLKKEPIVYRGRGKRRYLFKEIHYVTWTQLNKDSLDDNDLWSDYLPSRVSSGAESVVCTVIGEDGFVDLIFRGLHGYSISFGVSERTQVCP